VEPVRGHDREQSRSDRNEEMCPEPRLTLAELALDPDQPPEDSGEGEPQERLAPVERGQLREERRRAPPPARA
jgi:hypothetical protein